MGTADPVSLATAIARILILIPLVRFLHDQVAIHAKNGDVGRVRRATIAVDGALTLMLGNIVFVNLCNAFGFGYPVTAVRWTALVTSGLLAFALWRMWRVFRQVRYH